MPPTAAEEGDRPEGQGEKGGSEVDEEEVLVEQVLERGHGVHVA